MWAIICFLVHVCQSFAYLHCFIENFINGQKNYGIDLLIATRLNDICMNGYFYIETSTCVLK
jgi:hypothetical protein